MARHTQRAARGQCQHCRAGRAAATAARRSMEHRSICGGGRRGGMRLRWEGSGRVGRVGTCCGVGACTPSRSVCQLSVDRIVMARFVAQAVAHRAVCTVSDPCACVRVHHGVRQLLYHHFSIVLQSVSKVRNLGLNDERNAGRLAQRS